MNVDSKEEIALRILMSNDSEKEKIRKLEKMNFHSSDLKKIVQKLEKKVDKLGLEKGKNKPDLVEDTLLELSAELGLKDGKPRVRYYVPPNPKAFKFEELGDEQKKSAEKFAKQHPGLFKGLGKGEFNTGNGFDLVMKSNGVWKVKSESVGVNKEVETK